MRPGIPASARGRFRTNNFDPMRRAALSRRIAPLSRR
jgi:hypothetical protein